MQFFGFLQLLMALLGSSWSVLGGFGSRMGFPKVFQHVIKKKTPKKGTILGSKMVAKSTENGDRRLKAFSSGDSFFHFFYRF